MADPASIDPTVNPETVAAPAIYINGQLLADAIPDELVTAVMPEGDIVVRSMEKREIDMRVVPWDVVIDSPIGLESFSRGSFAHVDPKKVVLRLEHENPPAGRGIAVEERSDGAYMTFRVSKTTRGDEILTLANDGVTAHASVGYRPSTSQSELGSQNGRRVTRVSRADVVEVSTTWRPYYQDAAVLAVRAEPETPQPTPQGEPVPTEQPVEIDESRVMTSEGLSVEQARSLITSNEVMADRLERLENRARQEIIIPGAAPAISKARTGEWVSLALKMMSGERVSDIQVRALADLITSDNVGVVPDSVVRDTLIGIIDPARPFLETTTELPTPDSGLTLTVPVIVTRPTVGVQATEKADITSTITSITTTGFDAVTVAGGGDISIQLLKRSSPSYLDLYLRLLAEAYATEADVLAVATLLDSGTSEGSAVINPEALEIGEAWTNAVTQSRLLRPDHIWLSTRAIQEFIDAKASGTNAPLYSDLAADITVGNGARGMISGLTPVYVPAMDGSGADVIIGPRRGFAWAEDGTFTLQVDVPSKAGRDVAIVGILWFAPLYPKAFTTYRFAS